MVRRSRLGQRTVTTIVTGVMCAGLFAPMQSKGQTQSVSVSDFPTSNGPATLVINGTPGNDDVQLSFSDENWLVTAIGGISTTTCVQQDAESVRCRRYGSRIRVMLGPGKDLLRLSTQVVGGQIQGQDGSDQLLGSAARNVLLGGTGSDKIQGRGGDDRVIGERGSDQLRSGSGNDVIDAIDSRRDALIKCGSGKKDVARIDKDLDPKPKGCEKVLYTRGGLASKDVS